MLVGHVFHAGKENIFISDIVENPFLFDVYFMLFRTFLF